KRRRKNVDSTLFPLDYVVSPGYPCLRQAGAPPAATREGETMDVVTRFRDLAELADECVACGEGDVMAAAAPGRVWCRLAEGKAEAELLLDTLGRLDSYVGASVTLLPDGRWLIQAHFAAGG